MMFIRKKEGTMSLRWTSVSVSLIIKEAVCYLNLGYSNCDATDEQLR